MRGFRVVTGLSTSARFLLIFTLVIVVAGCGGGGGGGGGGDVTPPEIADVSYTSPISPRAGAVTIEARVTDAGGISKVEAIVTPPAGSSVTVPMTGTGGIYSGTYSYPANGTTEDKRYTLVVRAYDLSGNMASSPQYQFVVPKPDAPPPPPFSP